MGVRRKNAVLDVLEARVRLEKYDVVEEHQSKEHGGGSWRSHKMAAQVELAQSRLRAGQHCLAMVRRRRVELRQEKMSEWERGVLLKCCSCWKPFFVRPKRSTCHVAC